MDEFSSPPQPLDSGADFPQTQTPQTRPYSSAALLGTFAVFCFVGTLLGSLLTLLVAKIYGYDATDLAAIIGPDAPPDTRGLIRWMLVLSHLGTFLLPGVVTLLVFFRGNILPSRAALPFPTSAQHWLEYLRASRLPDWRTVVWAILLLTVSIPCVQYIYGLNKALPLPEWMHSMENQTADAVKSILKMDSPLELLANLLLMAAIPALGEELVFRGILQQQLARRLAPWAAILLAGAIFSAIHMQFEGFLARWALGSLLGFVFWRSGNFWVPVAAHFFNNGAQVVGAFLFQKQLTSLDVEQDVAVPYWAGMLSFLLTMALATKWYPEKTRQAEV